MNWFDRLRGGYWLPEETTVESYRRLLAQPDPEDLPKRGHVQKFLQADISKVSLHPLRHFAHRAAHVLRMKQRG